MLEFKSGLDCSVKKVTPLAEVHKNSLEIKQTSKFKHDSFLSKKSV